MECVSLKACNNQQIQNMTGTTGCNIQTMRRKSVLRTHIVRPSPGAFDKLEAAQICPLMLSYYYYF
eukprot:scaffold1525_cov142-Cylindrotheca_fusiformis.AAC.32